MSSIRFSTSEHEGRLQCLINTSMEGLLYIIETTNRDITHIFAIPYGTCECDLDVGPGAWASRVGVMTGEPMSGTIVWSPVVETVLECEKTPLPSHNPTFDIAKLLSIEEGLRLYTSMPKYSYCLAEVWKYGESRKNAKWYYYYNANDTVDIKHLQYIHQYNICIRVIESIPQSSVIQLCKGCMIEKRTAAKPNPYLDSTERTLRLSGNAIISQPRIKFSSHSEYLRYNAALVRSTLR